MSEYCFEFEIIADKRRRFGKEAALLKKTVFQVGNDSQNMAEKFLRLEAECRQTDIGYVLAVKSIIIEILVALIRNYNGCAKPQNRVKSALSDKRTLTADEMFLFEYATLTLDGLSKKLGLSCRQTQRFLKKTYGKSFSELRSEMRREKARELIKSGMSKQKAANAVGYERARSLSK